MGSPAGPIIDPGKNPITGIDTYPTLQNALANSAVVAALNAAQWNANLLAQYQNAWSMWAQQVSGGWIDPATKPAPIPPPAWVVAVGAEGYSSPVIGSIPICKVPPTPPGPPVAVEPIVNAVSVGIEVAGNPGWFTVGKTDGAPNGFVTSAATMSADGVPGPFRRFASPFGGAVGWYEKL
jgi:hypothetical protein